MQPHSVVCGITPTPTHTSVQPGCSMCCGLGARHASTPHVAHTVTHTCPCHHHHVWMPVWPSVPRCCCCCCCDVCCHRERRGEERRGSEATMP